MVVATLYGPVQDDMPRIEAAIAQIRDVEYEPLARMLDHVLGAGGKRLRPALALLAGTFGTYNLDMLVPLATSIEVLHTASLVHDDVIDAAPSRRGRATANALFNNAPSVMVGDFLFAHAADLIARTDNVPLIHLFARTLIGMTTGEIDQDLGAFDASKRISDYLHRIGGKTASLFATACEGGALAAGAPTGWTEGLRDYGFHLGMAFQIVDDILDVSGNEQAMGKAAGGDLREGTLTLPTLLLMEEDELFRSLVGRLFRERRGREARVERALMAIRESDVLARSMELAREYGDRAITAIESLPDTEAHATLRELIGYVLRRDH